MNTSFFWSLLLLASVTPAVNSPTTAPESRASRPQFTDAFVKIQWAKLWAMLKYEFFRDPETGIVQRVTPDVRAFWEAGRESAWRQLRKYEGISQSHRGKKTAERIAGYDAIVNLKDPVQDHPELWPKMPTSPRMGTIGLAKNVRVVQVISETSALVRVGDESTSGSLFLLRGINTTGVSDGNPLGSLTLKAVDTYRYAAVDGSTRTVPTVVQLPVDRYSAGISEREFLDAIRKAGRDRQDVIALAIEHKHERIESRIESIASGIEAWLPNITSQPEDSGHAPTGTRL